MNLALVLALAAPLTGSGGGPATNPPVFDSVTPCSQTLTATPTAQLTFQVSASSQQAMGYRICLSISEVLTGLFT